MPEWPADLTCRRPAGSALGVNNIYDLEKFNHAAQRRQGVKRPFVDGHSLTFMILIATLVSQVNTAIKIPQRRCSRFHFIRTLLNGIFRRNFYGIQHQRDGSILFAFACKTDGAGTPEIIFCGAGRKPLLPGCFSSLKGC